MTSRFPVGWGPSPIADLLAVTLPVPAPSRVRRVIDSILLSRALPYEVVLAWEATHPSGNALVHAWLDPAARLDELRFLLGWIRRAELATTRARRVVYDVVLDELRAPVIPDELPGIQRFVAPWLPTLAALYGAANVGG